MIVDAVLVFGVMPDMGIGSIQGASPYPGRLSSIGDELNTPTIDRSLPIYQQSVALTLCTDFQSAIELRKQESNFTCFTAAASGTSDCIMTGGGRMKPTKRFSK